MDTIVGAIKDIGEKRWLINFLLPSIFFVGISTVQVAVMQNGFGGLFLWWTGLSLDVKFSLVIGFLFVSSLIAALFDFATDSILGRFAGLDSGLEQMSFTIRWLHGMSRSRYLQHFREQNTKYQALATKDSLSYDEQTEIARLEEDLHNFPVQQGRIRSTKIGNLLSSVVEYTELRFGLDMRASWARMVYSVCPDTFREVLIESRLRLDLFLRIYLLVLVYVLFFAGYYLSLKQYVWFLLYLSIGFLTLVAVSRWSEAAAKDYVELVKSLYDLYRFDLYKALRIALPQKSGDVEISAGRQLSEHLWRGTNEIKYAEPPS